MAITWADVGRQIAAVPFLLAALALAAVPTTAQEAATPPRPLTQELTAVAQTACQSGLAASMPASATLLDDRQGYPLPNARAALREWRSAAGDHIRLTQLQASDAREALVFADLYAQGEGEPRALLRVVLGRGCRILGGRFVVYPSGAKQAAPASHIVHLGPDLQPAAQRIELNPAPQTGVPNVGCLRVAVLDSGVNYTLPQIAGRLAYDAAGRMVGYDFWDDDDRPYDYGFRDYARDPRNSEFNPGHHGTGVASVLLRELDDRAVCLAVYRYHPADRQGRIPAVIDRIAADDVRVVVLASSREQPWPEFATALRRNPGLLFVVAAGNGGRDLLRQPLYPSHYRLPNVLVVGATQADGEIWEHSNRGHGIVDIAVPAVRIAGFDHTGSGRLLSGTSLSAPRVAALAMALWRRDPGATAAQVRARLLDVARSHGTVDGDVLLLGEEDFKRTMLSAMSR